MFKTFGLQIRRDDLTHEQYVDHWLNVHAPMCRDVAQLQGYVANEVLQAGPLPGVLAEQPQFGARLDGVAQLHLPTLDGLQRLAEAPEVQRWFADGPNFVGVRTGFLTREYVLQTPGAPQRLPFKAISFVRAVPEQLHNALQAASTELHGGLIYSLIETITGSTNLPNFEVPAVDAAIEVWAPSPAQALTQLAELQRLAGGAVTWVSALIAREIVIRMPSQLPPH